MAEERIGQDVTYKFIIKTLKHRFFRHLGYEGENIVFENVEQIPMGPDQKIMDILAKVNGNLKRNIEVQSTPVYDSKMLDMYKYRIYNQADEFTVFKTTVFATYPPTQGIEEIEIDGDINFHPDFFYTKNLQASEILKTIKTKNDNKEELSETEAINLIIAPDTSHNYDMVELLEITSELLSNAVISDTKFRNDLIQCQRKMLQRFLKKDKREEIEIMYKFRAQDYGIEPNVTGIEEEIEISYQDGRQEGLDEGIDQGISQGIDETKTKIAKRLIQTGCDDKFIEKITDLEISDIEKLKKEIK